MVEYASLSSIAEWDKFGHTHANCSPGLFWRLTFLIKVISIWTFPRMCKFHFKRRRNPALSFFWRINCDSTFLVICACVFAVLYFIKYDESIVTDFSTQFSVYYPLRGGLFRRCKQTKTNVLLPRNRYVGRGEEGCVHLS